MFKKMKDFRIKTKTIMMSSIGIISLSLFLIVLTIMGFKVSKLLSQLSEGYYPALETSIQLKNTLDDIQRDMEYAVSAADEEALAETEKMKDTFNNLIEILYKNDIIRKSKIDSIRDEFNIYYPLAIEVSNQLLAGDMSEDVIDNLGKMQKIYTTIKALVDNQISYNNSELVNKTSDTRSNQFSVILSIIILVILSIILQSVFAYFFNKSITQPLAQIVHASDELAKGNVDFEIDIDSKDEIGELAKSSAILLDVTKNLAKSAETIGQGNYDIPINVRSEQDILGNALNTMKNNLKIMKEETELQDWFKTGEAELGTKMRGDQNLVDLSQNIIGYLASYLDAKVGAIYLKDDTEEELFKLAGTYAYKKRKNLSSSFKIGEGLVGQAALEKQTILITEVPDDYIKINSGLGESTPLNIFVTPLIYDDDLVGVIELGSFKEFTDIQLKFIEEAGESIAIAFQSAQSRNRVKELLDETQKQASELQSQQEELRVTNEELQAQQEELRVANEELEDQTDSLKRSEELLQQQQEELKTSNTELEKQTEVLRDRQEEIENKNAELEKARIDVEKKADELEKTSKYKSEFLANMSHELRTPLNSIQILSKLLGDNKDKNLTEKQITFAKTINSSGADLLELINEILDLSKIEAGKMIINLEKMSLKLLPSYVKQNFEHVTSDKNIFLKVEMGDNLPENISTDRQRVEQILKNLLSNSIKFTNEGGITFRIDRPDPSLISSVDYLDANSSVAISVIDTGVGISKEKQDLIFQAFQQADGTTSRKFGGTGLGLSISRELAKLLGGEIFLSSTEGEGSTFSIVLPESFKSDSVSDKEVVTVTEKETKPPEEPEPVVEQEPIKPVKKSLNIKNREEIRDDRLNIGENDKTILVVEDDTNFSKILFDFTREKGYKCLIANDGEAGLQLANQFTPNAIILDVGLPRIDGWTVMDRLKKDASTKHIPVYFISGLDKKITAMKMGAIGFLKKPIDLEDLDSAFDKIENTISKDIKKLLVIEDDKTMQESIIELVSGNDINIDAVDTGKKALTSLETGDYDCIIVDLGLHDISGFDLIEQINNDQRIADIPIIVYTGKELTKKEENRLRKHAESIIIKGAKSPERLFDEVSLFLHRVETVANDDITLKEVKNIESDDVFKNKKVLLVDDDVRNIFALSSILEEKGLDILVAENGKEAVDMVKQHNDIDLVLMDVMMPEMDGFEAMRQIRLDKKNAKLPLISLTAKAMKGDREKCIQAGANDYLSKPIDVEKLLSLLHVWLYA